MIEEYYYYYSDNQGVKVTVTLDTDERIIGWLYAEDNNKGVYLALDPEAANIRFIPREKWSSIDYPIPLT